MKALFCCMFCGLERADVEHENDACADCAKEAWRAAYDREEATPLDRMAEDSADRLQRMRDMSRAAAPLAAEMAALPSKIGATIPRFPGIVYHSPRVILEAERDKARAELAALDAKIPDLEADAAEREPSPSGAAPDDELDPNEEARSAAFQAAERELAALDEPLAGETWRAFHERAALEIIAHYTSGGAEEDTRAELREAIDHIVKAADEAAAERGAATVKRVEELLAAHHVQLGRALEMMKRAAVQEALSILNTATGAAVNALTAQDSAVD